MDQEYWDKKIENSETAVKIIMVVALGVILATLLIGGWAVIELVQWVTSK